MPSAPWASARSQDEKANGPYLLVDLKRQAEPEMIERRGGRILNDVGLRTRKSDRIRRHGVALSTSTFHLRWVEYLGKRRDPNIGGPRVG